MTHIFQHVDVGLLVEGLVTEVLELSSHLETTQLYCRVGVHVLRQGLEILQPHLQN